VWGVRACVYHEFVIPTLDEHQHVAFSRLSARKVPVARHKPRRPIGKSEMVVCGVCVCVYHDILTPILDQHQHVALSHLSARKVVVARHKPRRPKGERGRFVWVCLCVRNLNTHTRQALARMG